MGWPTKRQLRRFWRPFRVVAGFALLALAIWVIAGKSSELSGASAFLTQLHWFWLVPAAVAELGSFVALASVQRLLLGAGGVKARLSRVTGITFAGSSIQAALPIGAAFAGLYVFRQYEFAGADEVLAGWVVIATFTVAFTTLAALAGVGLAFAASTGSTFDLVGAILGVLVLTLLVVIGWVKRAKAYELVARAATAVERRAHRPAGQLTVPLARGLERMGTVAPGRQQWARAVVAGGADWVADCACLVFAFLAVGAPVPWQGLLLAYCAAQLAVNLPITPGGLGVVEGSLTVALVAFGGGRAPTVAAVLLYRVLSFWIPLPTGAACYLVLARERRRAERDSRAEAAGVAAIDEKPVLRAAPGSNVDGSAAASPAAASPASTSPASTSPTAASPAAASPASAGSAQGIPTQRSSTPGTPAPGSMTTGSSGGASSAGGAVDGSSPESSPGGSPDSSAKGSGGGTSGSSDGPEGAGAAGTTAAATQGTRPSGRNGGQVNRP